MVSGLPFRRRARSVLASFLISLSVAAFSFAAWVDWARPDIADVEHDTRLRYLRQRQTEKPGRPLALVIGSSRIAIACNPEILDPIRTEAGREVLIFNFSHFGAGPVMNRVVLERLKRDHIRPDLVVLEVMPAWLMKENTRFLTSHLSTRDLACLRSYVSTGSLYGNYLRNKLTGFTGALTHLDDQAIDPNVLSLGGYARLEESVDEASRQSRIVHQQGHLLRLMKNLIVSPAAARALRDSLNLLKSEAIPVVLLLSPEGPFYQTWYGPGCRERAVAHTQALAREYSVKVIDARDWLEEEDFFDSHHALRSGAVKFTRRLAKEVVQPALSVREWTSLSTSTR